MKARNRKSNNVHPVFDKEAEDKRYKRYQYRCYAYLVFEAFVSLLLGLFVMSVIRG